MNKELTDQEKRIRFLQQSNRLEMFPSVRFSPVFERPNTGTGIGMCYETLGDALDDLQRRDDLIEADTRQWVRVTEIKFLPVNVETNELIMTEESATEEETAVPETQEEIIELYETIQKESYDRIVAIITERDKALKRLLAI